MAVLQDTHSFKRNSTAAAVTIVTDAFAVGVNSDRALVALVTSSNIGSDSKVTGIADNKSGAWAKLGEVVNTGLYVQSIWYCIAPTTGAGYIVTATFDTANSFDFYIDVFSVYNCHQTTPVNNFNSGSIVTSVPSLGIAGDSDGIQYYQLSCNANPGAITSGTEISADVNNAYFRSASQTASPTATFSYTNSVATGVQCGCNVKAVSAGPTTTLMGQAWL